MYLMILQAVIPALLMNVYIVGLNQIFDIDIDKVCKWENLNRTYIIDA